MCSYVVSPPPQLQPPHPPPILMKAFGSLILAPPPKGRIFPGHPLLSSFNGRIFPVVLRRRRYSLRIRSAARNASITPQQQQRQQQRLQQRAVGGGDTGVKTPGRGTPNERRLCFRRMLARGESVRFVHDFGLRFCVHDLHQVQHVLIVCLCVLPYNTEESTPR